MPAIQPAKLKIQIAGLVETFNDPPIFLFYLDDFLELYADRTLRQGLVVSTASLLNTLGIPRQVIHQLNKSLQVKANEFPRAALEICVKIWGKPYAEYRIIVAHIMKCIPTRYKPEILLTLENFKNERFDKASSRILLEEGLSSLMDENSDEIQHVAENWLTSNKAIDRQFGILLLEVLVSRKDFQNNPRVFRQVAPLIRQTPREIRPLMPSLILAFQSKNPQETAFLLTEALQASDNPDAGWIIRQTIHEFPEEMQSNLRQALRKKQMEIKTLSKNH